MAFVKLLLVCLPFMPAMLRSDSPQAGIPEKYKSRIDKVVTFRDQVRAIHPILEKLYPIALVEDKTIFVFEIDEKAKNYRLSASVPDPYDLPKGIRAAMPLGFWNNRTACVVSGEIFDEPDGYVMIAHEFVHCAQAEICEMKIKDTLRIYQDAMKRKEYSWELQYPFPYGEETFTNTYAALMKSLDGAGGDPVEALRAKLRSSLTSVQWEYMTWQEWKEGLARFLENRMRDKLGLKENTGGSKPPCNRVSFYYGGDRLIRFLTSRNPSLANDIEKLYLQISGK